MKPYFKTAFTLFCGLIVFQLTASLKVFLSNCHLAATMETALREGYLAVPNALILPDLKGPGMALAGGLFFTLTAGALVTLLSLVTSAAFRAWPERQFIKVPVFTGLVLLFLIWINQHGVLALESIGIILVSFTVYILDHLLSNESKREKTLWIMGVHMIFPFVLAIALLVFSASKGNRIFSDFRDTFLMNNPVGMAINDFYYRYTLAPAEVFKPLDNKLIKTVTINAQAKDKVFARRIERRLIALDYLPLEGIKTPDLRVEYKDENLHFYHEGRPIAESTFQNFSRESSMVISSLSKKEDRYGPYRALTHTGLQTGFPLLMYLLLHMCLFWPAAFFLSPKRAAFAASGACFIMGAICFGFLFMMNPVTLTTDSIPESLASQDLATRISALRLIHEKELNIMAYPEAMETFQSPRVVERYWAARASAFSPDPETFERLIALLKDSNLNVQTQACYALGRSKNRKAKEPIYSVITSTPHWYVQWYAYRALRRLGWIQKKSVR